ncbi:MAG: stimulus-sensing domain-containing protein [Rhodospirillales bacterium]|nr:stimulus-sensing domain-containing protein [Rhodospirillales bacterium]
MSIRISRTLKRSTGLDIATAPPDGQPALSRRKSPRRAGISPITRRILAVNLLALGFLFAGMLYLDEYRRGLIAAELATMRSEANLFAAAVGESATFADSSGTEGLIPLMAQQIVRRLIETSHFRARLFNEDGTLVADSLVLGGPGGSVQIEELPAPRTEGQQVKDLLAGYDRILTRLWSCEDLPLYVENAVQAGRDYPEVMLALSGEAATTVRADANGGMVLSVAVPVQRYKQVLAALMLTKDSTDIDTAVLKVRLDVFKWFLAALAITVLLSIYLAGTIARPILRLAAAAELVRSDRHRRHTIPDFGTRRDEIGRLAAALRDMTQALWLRIDAIERFAADVAHELKNPLTSLRSAVETAARITDPERRQKLMNIILEDVSRLDRLISDISDASRLDAELSRENSAAVDIRRMLAALMDVTESTAMQRQVRLILDVDHRRGLVVNGVEGRLVQVFRNLIANALSFSPPASAITLKARREGKQVVAEVLDQGPGIPEGLEDDIFQRFYSERPQDEKFGQHSGLGLSISKQIVEAHGGTIVAENRRDPTGRIAGARFVVRLPGE